jgi:hypothetical protein
MLMLPTADAPLRCRRMGETPIYDQVRGERINADVPASKADSQPARCHGKHRLLPDTPVPATVAGPPGVGDGLAPNCHRRVWTSPAGPPAANGQPAATAWDRERPCPRKPIRDKRPDTPPAAPRGPQPTATQQPGTREQRIAVLTLEEEAERDR